ncbi:tRNA (adenosine(37)-N6)-dimethylallyltransferase MiaA [Patescibacteria group bacterium]
MNKLLIICGPTAIGKTSLAANLAKKFKGELISADSRQVYQGMDIVTGKDKPKGVVIHGLDLVKPDQEFSVAHFVKFALPLINKLHQAKVLPIVVGGTGLYLKALTQSIDTINTPPNKKLRKQLEKLTTKQLQSELKQLNPQRFNKMNHSDQHNPRRLIRAIEVASTFTNLQGQALKVNFNTLWIGLTTSKSKLNQRIEDRVKKRIKQGAFKEKQRLLKQGYDLTLPSMSGIGYKHLPDVQAWTKAEQQYATRQMTWFKKQPHIHWFDIKNNQYFKKVVTIATDWYTN